jgi:hypothetical protein
MRPAMRVHPLVAPQFSTAEHALADEQVADHEILSQGKAAVRLDSSGLIEARARFTPATQWYTRSTVDEFVEPNRNNLVHEPLLTRDVPVAPATRRWSEEAPSPSSRLTGRAAEGSPAQQIAPPEDRAKFRDPDHRDADYEPLIHTITTSVPRLRTDPRHESPQRPLPQHQQQGAAEPVRPAVPKHEPDEIQITIGRIEVTAVPDAPRPVPKPARKQLSLDDYLKQADARGR